MPVKTFDRDQMIARLEEGDYVCNDLENTTRWSAIYRFVFQTENDRYWETSYSTGLTEIQDEHPWENETKIKCFEVERYQKTVDDYRKIYTVLRCNHN